VIGIGEAQAAQSSVSSISDAGGGGPSKDKPMTGTKMDEPDLLTWRDADKGGTPRTLWESQQGYRICKLPDRDGKSFYSVELHDQQGEPLFEAHATSLAAAQAKAQAHYTKSRPAAP
jgi:hypothetical protein